MYRCYPDPQHGIYVNEGESATEQEVVAQHKETVAFVRCKQSEEQRSDAHVAIQEGLVWETKVYRKDIVVNIKVIIMI